MLQSSAYGTKTVAATLKLPVQFIQHEVMIRWTLDVDHGAALFVAASPHERMHPAISVSPLPGNDLLDLGRSSVSGSAGRHAAASRQRSV
jgi:hypothetical protein